MKTSELLKQLIEERGDSPVGYYCGECESYYVAGGECNCDEEYLGVSILFGDPKMKASEFIKVFEQLIAEHGDLPVGYYVSEYGCFSTIDSIDKRESNSRHGGYSYDDDDKELGEKFFGIR